MTPGRTIALLTILSFLVACQSGAPTEPAIAESLEAPESPSEAESIETLPFDSGELSERLEKFLDEFDIAEGNWREEGGARICDGYMTRFEDQDFCASTVPDDWEAFEFDGETYYLQPLSESDARPPNQ